ncbi:Holliday junction resolvase RuvX [Spiroplasma endosymbiont of Anurida maritima]|uniref:Holliday junction resolvase RuvX n=1 Tax=Spiroplasma endosymbiont of Anurida maritima TaxID=2967972 RepID=UPI0036D3649C
MASYIGLDLGTKTIGIATSQGIIASAKDTIRFEEDNFEQGAQMILEYINKENIDEIVIGYPINMDGTIGYRAQMVDYFVELLLDLNSSLIIHKYDERMTSRMAGNIMLENNTSRAKRKINKDKLAAQIILSDYLKYNKNSI